MLTMSMPFTKIYVATDLSEPAQRATAQAARLAKAAGATLVVLHVYDPVPEFSLGPEATGVKLEKLRRLAEEQLEATIASKYDVPVDTKVVVGADVAGTICKVVEEGGADLLVVSSLGRTGLPRFLLGSVAERTVREASCPVWVVREGEELPARFQVCTDLSAGAANGIELTREVMASVGGKAELVHALQDPAQPLALETRRSVERERREELSVLYTATFGGEPRVTVTSGSSPVQAIIAHAERTSPDVLVLATAGRTGLERLLIGSVAERVVRFAPCSVLVARGRERS